MDDRLIVAEFHRKSIEEAPVIGQVISMQSICGGDECGTNDCGCDNDCFCECQTDG